ncbi:MAG: flagellar biosynthesis protein FlhF [Desulfobacterales bacterium]|nr:MAG: flagellar biosynthesis protein FlhF [Desulfobacterales bacterium]
MQIKRFEAPNMTAALRLIKDELGPEAVILSARSLKKGRGIFGVIRSAGVEVTAATDSIYPLAGKNKAPLLGKFPRAQRPRHTENTRRNPSERVWQPWPKAKKTLAGPPQRDVRPGDRTGGQPRVLYEQLRLQEVNPELAEELTAEIEKRFGPAGERSPAEARSDLASLLTEMSIAAGPITVGDARPKAVALIGATGVGKTTTVAKLAARHHLRHNQRVALISLDNYRIAAMEQLKVYAQIIGIPLEGATRAAELAARLKELKDMDLVLIDTPGFSPTNAGQIRELTRSLDQIDALETHLLLSAATKETDLLDISARLKKLPVQRLIFTKLDETRTCGSLLNVFRQTRIPLSYFTDGQQVPDHIERVSAENLTARILELAEAPDAGAEATERPLAGKTTPASLHHSSKGDYIANRNSDVYHFRDCKWCRKIKPENIITFASQQEAESQNFMPCRNCNPTRAEIFNAVPPAGEKIKISGYR